MRLEQGEHNACGRASGGKSKTTEEEEKRGGWRPVRRRKWQETNRERQRHKLLTLHDVRHVSEVADGGAVAVAVDGDAVVNAVDKLERRHVGAPLQGGREREKKREKERERD